MTKAFSVAFTTALALALPLAIAQDNRPLPAQAERGKQLFLKSAKGTACSTCHFLAGAGNAIGPDLSKFASIASVHSLVMTIKMTMTNEVQLVKTSDAKFPGMLKQKQGDETEIWDLSQMPPVL